MTGQTILHYHILEELGRGGMGEVYKAKDTKLDRFVALKFLPSHLTASEEDKNRFIQEAKAASALNHPNVCTIFDIQENEGQLFIVMEFIDGKTLKEKKDQLSEKQILEICIQTAEGLAAAHEKGIVHRDIKPENIMIRKDGIVQIMDFGLAKLRSVTGASRLTKMGTTVGTMGYMSPEQVQGLDVDHRTDIFSLGVVLYELLSGESPFKGMHETAIMYEIVNVDPPLIATIKDGIDPQLDEIIRECLEKDKDERCQSAKELARNLRKLKRSSSGSRASRIFNVNSQTHNVRSGSGSNISSQDYGATENYQSPGFKKVSLFNTKILWSLLGILSVVIILLLVFYVFSKQEINYLETKSSILPPENVVYDNTIGSNVAISPNGKFIAFVGKDSTGSDKLWVRPVNSLTARILTDASPASYPFWSPDNKFIAYFNNDKLMKISLEAGTSLPICDVRNGRGGSWSINGYIIIAPDSYGGLYKVNSSGGKLEQVVKVDTTNPGLSLRWPHFLPDGENFVYMQRAYGSITTAQDGIYAASLDDQTSKMLLNSPSTVQFADGYLFYVRQSLLFAQSFDPSNFELKGEGIPIAENVQFYPIRNSGTFSVSQNGCLIYQKSNILTEKIVSIDKSGKILNNFFNKPTGIGELSRALLSNDESKIVYDLYDQAEDNVDLWIYDMKRNVNTRLTFNHSIDGVPIWSSDDSKIYFSSNRASSSQSSSNFNLFVKNTNGSGEEKVIYTSEYDKYLSDISPDDGYLLISAVNNVKKRSGWDIEMLPLTGDKKIIEFLSADFNEYKAKFSPNMKWIAYQSDESGKYQIYITPFDGKSGKWQISVEGGTSPKFVQDGKKIYFISLNNKIMSVDLNESATTISPGEPREMFSHQTENISSIYDFYQSGDKFIAGISLGDNANVPITFVTNWQKETEDKK